MKEDTLEKLSSTFHNARITILTLNTSSETISTVHDGCEFKLIFGDDVYSYISDTPASLKEKLKVKTEDYILSLTNELLASFSEEK